jgi:formylmethanofuran dehydrogenase subunit E
MGIRMARLACAHLGIAEPRKDRDLVAFVEMGRCAADAVYVVTGITVGLKLLDQGRWR